MEYVSVGWFGLVWFGLVWFGLVWFGLVWFGLVWFGLVWFGLVWFGLVWFGCFGLFVGWKNVGENSKMVVPRLFVDVVWFGWLVWLVGWLKNCWEKIAKWLFLGSLLPLIAAVWFEKCLGKIKNWESSWWLLGLLLWCFVGGLLVFWQMFLGSGCFGSSGLAGLVWGCWLLFEKPVGKIPKFGVSSMVVGEFEKISFNSIQFNSILYEIIYAMFMWCLYTNA